MVRIRLLDKIDLDKIDSGKFDLNKFDLNKFDLDKFESDKFDPDKQIREGRAQLFPPEYFFERLHRIVLRPDRLDI